MEPAIQVFFATVSGNAEALANETVRVLAAKGRTAVAWNLADRTASELAAVETALFVVSTWGDGEPPPDAARFFAEIAAPEAPPLDRTAYAVLALGSSRYPEFCACGRRLDEDLSRLGARRLLPRTDCDVKLKATFQEWLHRVVQATICA